MREIKFLSKLQSERLLAVIKNQRHKVIVLLMLDCGLRVSETICLKFNHFDFKNKLVIVNSLKKKKENDKRKVPLSIRLYQELASYFSTCSNINADAFLLPSSANLKGHITRNSVNKFLSNLRKKLKKYKVIKNRILL